MAKIDELFATNDEMNALLDEDSQRFARAMEQATGSFLKLAADASKSVLEFPEPVGPLARSYQADIDLEQVACELSFDRRTDLQSRIRDSKRLRDLGLGTLAEGDVIKRSVWEKAVSNPASSSANNGWNPARASLFQVVADELGLGTPVTP